MFAFIKRSIYGLKQSLRVWFGKFSSLMLQVGSTRTSSDHSVFSKRTSVGCIIENLKKSLQT